MKKILTILIMSGITGGALLQAKPVTVKRQRENAGISGNIFRETAVKGKRISKKKKEAKKLSTIEEFHQIIRNDMVEFACKHVGNPYVWGGNSLTEGVDCSGFTQAVLKSYGVNIPRTAEEQAKYGHEITIAEMQPGDLLFYSRGKLQIGHVGIYIGDGKIVHAAGKKTGIEISRYDYKTPRKVISCFPEA
ncbi:MAG: C40 family peptidase [Fusobacteriaceae bacterium]|nr:C40 family peptidase [Fusobacteriaceae bacterium]